MPVGMSPGLGCTMKPVTIELPAELVALFGSEDGARRGATQAVVFDLVRQGKISRAKAAEILGIALADLPAVLAQYRIPWFDCSEADLDTDLRTLDRKGDLTP